MDIIRFTLANPVKVAVGVILICLFGGLALFQIPIQLTPDVDEPRITVTTRWQGKSAREVEREIVERQEEKLKGVPNLRKMTSTAREGMAEVVLEFFVGIDKNIALRDTDAKLNQVTGYPIEADRPEVVAADAAMESPIAWLILRADDGRDVAVYRDFIWDNVKPVLERVDGLASVDVFGGREQEVHVLIDPERLAARGLTLRTVEEALRAENVNISAGTRTQGKREFVYRTEGEYSSTEEIERTVVAYQDGGPVVVGDVGRAEVTFMKETGFVRSRGEFALGLPARRETGANVIEVMRGLRRQIELVNREILHPRGLGLELTQVYDETVYINSSIAMVRNNLFIGGALAIVILMLFLRSPRATGVVAVSIPVSVVGTILGVTLLGRNINVVMLAGMAFAVGMVVDNAVVVLENIYRHRQMGKSAFEAAQDGATEVWGALVASTLTTMAVFVPVIFVEEEAGQLFRDIAIAISAGVGMSLLVSVLVIPTMSARVLGGRKYRIREYNPGRLATWVAGTVTWLNRSLVLRLVVIVTFVSGSLGGAYLLLPPTDYLPSGNRNLVFGAILTEPGLSVHEFRELARDVESYLRPYWTAEPGSPEAEAFPMIDLPMAGGGGANGPPRTVKVKAPLIDNFFFVVRNNACFMGATSRDDANVKPLEVLMQQAVYSSRKSVGAMAFFRQAGLFGRVRGGGSVDLEVRGFDLEKVTQAATLLRNASMEANVGFVQPDPNTYDLLQPEIRAVPDRIRSADIGLNVRDIGFFVEAAVDGAYVGGYRYEAREIDMRLKLENADRTPIRDVRDIPVHTMSGHTVPLTAVVDFVEVGTPQQINHIEELPAVTLQIMPPPDVTVETVMATMERRVIAPLRESGMIDDTILTSLAGNADKLVQTRAAMFGRWTGFNAESIISLVQSRGFLALLVIYLLLSALFESFIHPLAIMLTVPLAVVGGFAGLRLVHWLSLMNPVTPIQQLDVVTMLGFIILLGIVVNNAILIVHQTLNNLSAGMTSEAALHESVKTRIRPIFMTALTSVGGMLPLALMAGAGSELYRGLASVMVGGLLVATVFTVILVPVVFSMFLNLRIQLLQLLGREAFIARGAVPEPQGAAASATHGGAGQGRHGAPAVARHGAAASPARAQEDEKSDGDRARTDQEPVSVIKK